MISFNTSFSLFKYNPARLHISDRTVITLFNYHQLSRNAMSSRSVYHCITNNVIDLMMNYGSETDLI